MFKNRVQIGRLGGVDGLVGNAGNLEFDVQVNVCDWWRSLSDCRLLDVIAYRAVCVSTGRGPTWSDWTRWLHDWVSQWVIDNDWLVDWLVDYQYMLLVVCRTRKQVIIIIWPSFNNTRSHWTWQHQSCLSRLGQLTQTGSVRGLAAGWLISAPSPRTDPDWVSSVSWNMSEKLWLD